MNLCLSSHYMGYKNSGMNKDPFKRHSLQSNISFLDFAITKARKICYLHIKRMWKKHFSTYTFPFCKSLYC